MAPAQAVVSRRAKVQVERLESGFDDESSAESWDFRKAFEAVGNTVVFSFLFFFWSSMCLLSKVLAAIYSLSKFIA